MYYNITMKYYHKWKYERLVIRAYHKNTFRGNTQIIRELNPKDDANNIRVGMEK